LISLPPSLPLALSLSLSLSPTPSLSQVLGVVYWVATGFFSFFRCALLMIVACIGLTRTHSV
jgi:hypothetical protein